MPRKRPSDGTRAIVLYNGRGEVSRVEVHGPDGQWWAHGVLSATDRRVVYEPVLHAPLMEAMEPEPCASCRGTGHFSRRGKPSIDGRDRKCLDCSGTGQNAISSFLKTVR